MSESRVTTGRFAKAYLEAEKARRDWLLENLNINTTEETKTTPVLNRESKHSNRPQNVEQDSHRSASHQQSFLSTSHSTPIPVIQQNQIPNTTTDQIYTHSQQYQHNQPTTIESQIISTTNTIPDDEEENGQRDEIENNKKEETSFWEYFKGLISLNELTMIEKIFVVSFLLISFILTFQAHYLTYLIQFSYLHLSHLYTYFFSQFLQEFLGDNGMYTILSIMIGATLNLLFDRQILHSDLQMIQLITIFYQPFMNLTTFLISIVTSIGMNILSFSLLPQFFQQKWSKLPRSIQSIIILGSCLLSFRYLCLPLILSFYQQYKIYVITGSYTTLIVSIILLILYLILVLYQSYQQRIYQKEQIIMTVKQMLLQYLQQTGSVQPIKYIYQQLLDQEKLRLINNNNNNNNNNNIDNHENNKVLLILPSIEIMNGWKLKSIWQEVVREMTVDERVQTTTQLVHGAIQPCWRLKTSTITPIATTPAIITNQQEETSEGTPIRNARSII
jgi:hypothetical protein